MAPPSLFVIAGPTASGKSSLALALAEAIGGTGAPNIVRRLDGQEAAALSALAAVFDDLQHVLRCCEHLVGVLARPDAAEEARAPHRLFGYIDGAEACSAARWAGDARAILGEVERPILVGGTGLYLRTLFDGIAPVPEIDPAVRTEVRALPVADARGRLLDADPAAAARLAPGDTTRIARALEVILSTGRPLAAWQAERIGGIGHAGVTGVVLTPDRADLHALIERRCDAMLSAGALDETERLLTRSLDPTLPAMRAIGVAPLGRHLAGELSLAEARERIVRDTRHYAKRQETWFRHQAPAGWLRTVDPAAALAHLRAAC